MSVDVCGLAPLLAVFDMPASLRFYRDMLGFTLVTRSGEDDDCGWALLRLNGVEIMLNTAFDTGERPPAPDPARTAAHGDTSLYFGCADLDGAYRHLRAHGFDVKEPAIAPYGMGQLNVRDPDGYHLCFQWPASEERVKQWRESYGFDPTAPRA